MLTGLGLFLIASALPGGGAVVRDDERAISFAQLQIRQRIIVRIPTRAPTQTPTRWRERTASRCQPIQGLAGAAVMEADSVDFLFSGGRRIRAELEDECSGLDFYSGFYLAPTADRQICAGRDSIHARSGGQCEIRRFRSLVPRP